VKKAGEPAVAVSAVTRGKVGAGTTVGAPVVGMKVGSGVLAIVGKLDVGVLVTGAFVCPAEVGCWVTTPTVGFSVAPIAVGKYVVGCELVGIFEGKAVGITVGVAVGNQVGCQVGNWEVGDFEGAAVGTTVVGRVVGKVVGVKVGSVVGTAVGLVVGCVGEVGAGVIHPWPGGRVGGAAVGKVVALEPPRSANPVVPIWRQANASFPLGKQQAPSKPPVLRMWPVSNSMFQ